MCLCFTSQIVENILQNCTNYVTMKSTYRPNEMTQEAKLISKYRHHTDQFTHEKKIADTNYKGVQWRWLSFLMVNTNWNKYIFVSFTTWLYIRKKAWAVFFQAPPHFFLRLTHTIMFHTSWIYYCMFIRVYLPCTRPSNFTH